jgi:hypothetical protein
LITGTGLGTLGLEGSAAEVRAAPAAPGGPPKEVGPMAVALQRPHLNSDGERHPRENALAISALVIGVVSFALAMPAGNSGDAIHIVGAILGAIGIVVSIWAQYVSVTTGERWTIIPGWVCAGLGFALNIFFAVN